MEEIKEQYTSVFQGLGKLEQPHHMKMDPKAVPVTQTTRKIQATLRSKLKEELDRMETDEVVAKVDKPTEWVQFQLLWKKKKWKTPNLSGPSRAQQLFEERILPTTHGQGRNSKSTRRSQML